MTEYLTEQVKSKQNHIGVGEHHVLINNIKEFAVLERRPSPKGYQGITFSMPITEKDVSVITDSKIAQVISFSESGTMLFKRRDFYENSLMYELIIDILKRHE